MITSCFGYFEDATFLMCDIVKIKKEKKYRNKEMIPLKESLEMFYILRVALKEDVKMLFWSTVGSCIAKTTFCLFFS